MRIIRGVFLMLLILPIAGLGLLNAKPQTQQQNGARNSTASITREVRHELTNGAVVHRV